MNLIKFFLREKPSQLLSSRFVQRKPILERKLQVLIFQISFLLLLSLLVLFPLGQLSRIPLPWPEVRVYWQDLVIMATLLHCCIVLLFGREKLKIPQLIRPILLFGFVGLVSLGINAVRFSGREVMVGVLYLVRWLAYAGVYWAVLQLNQTQRSRLTEYLLFAGFGMVVLGLTQYAIYPNAWPLTADQWDPHVGRIIGTFLDPGFTGLIYVFTFLAILVKYWPQLTKIRLQDALLPYFLLLTSYLALLLTYSRSAYLALIAGIGMVALVKRSPRFFVGFLLVFAFSLPLLPRPHGEGTKLERQSTVRARLQNWRESFEIAKDYPALGSGFNLYRYEQRERGFLGEKWQVTHAGAGADSSYLFVWATTGLAGLGTLVWLGKEVWQCGWRNRNRTWGLVLVSSLAAAGVHSWFNNALFYPWVMIWLWILIGMVESKEYTERKG